ncbi:hypothetical protein UPYG_G00308540 [Umbra pygmaea]|uniref:RING finger protein 17 n=1 Tax=Umbra pygmaea TaxID=75934 RepID=A0ABD0WIS6_UMBPY
MSDSSLRADHPTCKICGVAYTLKEGEIIDNFPQVLLCGHIFCTSCLRLLELNNVITCPECKVESMLPEGGVEGLEVDSRIIGLIYTAKINKMKKPKQRRQHSSPSPEKQETKQGKDVKEAQRALREALSQASINMTNLENIHQALLKGHELQVKREKARLLKELEKVMEKTFSLVSKREAALVAELTHIEQHFPSSRRELFRVEARMRALETAIQKAKQVHQHPSLESYCHLDQLLESLQAPVDVQSFDMKGLSLGSGISYIFQQEDLRRSLKAYLKSIVGDAKIMPEEEVYRDGERNPKEAGPHSKAAQLPPIPVSDTGPNVIIEEIFEESEPVQGVDEETLKSCHEVTTASSNAAARPSTAGPPAQPPPASERHRSQRTNRKMQEENSGRQGVVEEFVIVTHVENPNHFYVRHAAEDKSSVSLYKKINSLCSGDSGLLTVNNTLESGSTVLVKWNEAMWGRATLTEVFQRGHQGPVRYCPVPQLDRISVFFQDYGFCKSYSFRSEELSSDLLIKDLNQRVRTVCMASKSEINRWPPQAIKCSLKDIVPAEVTKGWSIEAKDEFLHAVGSSSVEMQIFAAERSALLVDLKIFPNNSSKKKMPMSLREYLVLLELARFYCPVTWNSKMAQGGRKPLQFYSPVFPRPNIELNAVVYHIDTPSHFYIQLQVDNSEFLLLTAKLQDYYSYESCGKGSRVDDQSMDVYCPVVGQACVARFDDKVWSRARIVDIPGGRKVEVQFVDFGNKKVISVNDIKKIKDEFFSLPAMAIQCYLADVTSPEDDETWSEAAIEKFKSLADQRLVTAVATEAGRRRNGLPVQLFKTGNSSKSLDNIAEMLVNEHMACFKKCIESRDTQNPVVDTTVWDPPFESGLGAEAAPAARGQETSEINEDPQEIQPNLVLPACLKNLRVKVTHVVSPGSFYVQLLNLDKQLKRLYEVLKQDYSRTEPQDVEWKADMYCAAYINGVWERGQICSNVPLKGIAEVLRCDFGNKVKLHVNNLRPLLPSLVGCQLLECALSDIRPAGGRSTWTATACDFISYYLTGAQAIMTITDKTDKRPVPVTLYCSNRAGRDVSIADFLVSEGLALKDRQLRAAPERAAPERAAPERAAPERAAPERAALKPNLEEMPDSKSRVLENRPPNLEIRPPSDQSAQHRPLNTVPPMPAPRTNPPPEKVKTQAYCPPELPHCGRIQMTVSAIGDDGVIYARTHHAERQLEQLRERLQQHIKTLPRLKPYKWKSVLGCVVMGSDMLWYRAHVLEVIGGHVKVRYVDQGLVENIPACHVYPTMLCEDIPQLCIPCQLYGVIPVGKSWQCDATAMLKELLLNRCLDLQVMELPADPLGCLTVHISLDGMSVGKIMVHHQHASADQTVEALGEELLASSHLDLDDWDLDLEGFEESEPVLRVLTYPDLPEKGQRFPVTVKHLRTPNEVFLYLLEEDSCVESGGESLEEALKDVNDEIDNLAILSDFAIEAPCLAQYSDGKYYRAKLLGFAGLNPVKLLVRHVDFGSDDTLPTQKLRQMPAHLLQYPCKAIKVRVAGFKPRSNDLDPERLPYRPEWSMKAVLEMIGLLHSCRTASVTVSTLCLSHQNHINDYNGLLA